MIQPRLKFHILAVCILSSVLLHLLPVLAFVCLGSFRFGAPVNLPAALVVDWAPSQGDAVAPGQPAVASAAVESAKEPSHPDSFAGQDFDSVPASASLETPSPGSPPAVEPEEAEAPAPKPALFQAPPAEPAKVAAATAAAADPGASRRPAPRQPVQAEELPLKAAQFLPVPYERLSYLLSMQGIPVGSAELESRQENNQVTITLRVRTNAALSTVYPVNNLVETRHIDGRFIMTKIQQQEGAFRSDEMFTINLRRKRVSWVDFLHNHSLQLNVPAGDVLDTLSGIYYLRNRQLQVGATQTLHIFDSESYADVPVEILRREELRLPNLSKVATLVVRPLQKTAGVFRRTGELLVWMTDDEHKVPVKIVTTISLGKVTAELISAESTPAGAVKEGEPAAVKLGAFQSL